MRYNWKLFVTQDLIEIESPSTISIRNSDTEKISKCVKNGYNMFNNRLRLSGKNPQNFLQTKKVDLDQSIDSLNALSLLFYVVTTLDNAVYKISGSYDQKSWEEIDTINVTGDSDKYNALQLTHYNYYKVAKLSGNGEVELFLADNVTFNLLVKCCAHKYTESLGIRDSGKWVYDSDQLHKEIDNYSRINVVVDCNKDGSLDNNDKKSTTISTRMSL